MGADLITDSPRGQRRRRSHRLLGRQGPQAAVESGHGTGHSALPHPAGQRGEGGSERDSAQPPPGLDTHWAHNQKALPQSRPASIPHSLARPSPRLLPLGAPPGGRPPRGEQRPAQRQSKSRGHFPQVWVQPHTRPPQLYERLVLTVGDCDRNHVGTTQEGWPGRASA